MGETKLRPRMAGGTGMRTASRHELNAKILADMVESWEFYGIRALKEMAIKEPGKFVQVFAALLPKQVQVDVTENMTEDQLVHRIRELAAELGVTADLSLAEPPRSGETTH